MAMIRHGMQRSRHGRRLQARRFLLIGMRFAFSLAAVR
jgi:hypothetical protein